MINDQTLSENERLEAAKYECSKYCSSHRNVYRMFETGKCDGLGQRYGELDTDNLTKAKKLLNFVKQGKRLIFSNPQRISEGAVLYAGGNIKLADDPDLDS